jgi:outer membrane protein OmpA-like peptidoglycan-associated protein
VKKGDRMILIDRCKVIKLLLVTLPVIFLIGCGGSSNNNSSPTLTGTFIDSPVSGLEYSTPSKSGTTDSSGHFQYKNGEVVTFSIGGIIIGQSVGDNQITPLDLVEGANDAFDSTVSNILRFLQSLDSDCNPDNGISITSTISDEVFGRDINFSASIADFENDVDIDNLFATLNSINAFSGGCIGQLIDLTQARVHFWETYDLINEDQVENENINFDHISSELSQDAQFILTQKGYWILNNPSINIVIEGHCADNEGDNAYCLSLGELRAQAAADFLIDYLGIDPSRLATISYGKERPLDLNATEEAYSINRRATFVLP